MKSARTIVELHECLHALEGAEFRAVDTETTGKHPYHGDKLFSVIVATEAEEYYLDFNKGGAPRRGLKDLAPFFSDKNAQTYFVNALFDLAMLKNEGLEVSGKIIDVPSLARVEYNLHTGKRVGDDESLLSLDYLLGFYFNKAKDDKVMSWIKENGAYKIDALGEKAPDFTVVPWGIIYPYGCSDARFTFDLGNHISQRIVHCHEGLLDTAKREVALTPALFRMKRHGLTVDTEYTQGAYDRAVATYDKVMSAVQAQLGADFNLKSGKQVAAFIEGHGITLPRTAPTKTKPNGGPKTDAKTLERFADKIPILNDITTAKKSLKKANTYYKNFLHLKDKNNIIHCNINQNTTVTGRCSSSKPNLQNLHKEKFENPTTDYVRKSFRPVQGNLFFFDYKQQEMVVMADQAEEMRLVDKMREGFDFYDASRVIIESIAGKKFTRHAIKQVCLGVAYGQGNKLLAKNLGITEDEAKRFRAQFFRGLPAISRLANLLKIAVKTRGYVTTAYGRKLHVARDKDYKAINAYVQGSSADMTKAALVDVDEWLLQEKMKSALCLQVHDELVLDVVPDEEKVIVENVKRLMIGAYKHKHIPMSVDVEYSPNGASWVEKIAYTA